MSGVIGFPGATAVGRGGGLAAGVVGASVAEGTGHSPHCHCRQVTWGCEQHCGWEAGVSCAASPAAAGFPGPAGSAAVAGGRQDGRFP